MNSSSFPPQEVIALDQSDKLAAKRDEFLIPKGTIYLNGNSLGPLTRHAQQRINEVVLNQWGQDLIASWNTHAWIDMPFSAGEKIARLVGAAPGQLVCCDSVSINLLKVLACCLQLRPARQIILSQEDNFPTDLYIAQGLEALMGSSRCRLKTVAATELLDSLQEDVAALFLTQVNFRDGEKHDIERLTSLAQEKGILLVWDLSHSVGVLPLQLDRWGVDFAVGCGYKYLNGGPGSPAFIYANKKHHTDIRQPVQGWMGHAEPFAFTADYRNAEGVAQFLTGTPPILSLAALDSALDVFADIGMTAVNAKAMALAELFLSVVRNDEDLQGLNLESREGSESRGAQLAFSHPYAYEICRALNKAGVVVDFRSPDIVRFGFSPLFLRFEDIWQAARILKETVREKTYLADEFSKRLKVT